MDPRESDLPRLTVELEREAMRAVARTYHDLNATFFRGALRSPILELTSSERHLGRWHGPRRTLELSRCLLVRHDWGVLVEVLKHEMAHQFVDEVLGVPDETSHGPAFQQVCAERGFDARAAGVPVAPEGTAGAHPSPEAARLLERISKLLALAASDSEHEAQNATLAAQRLMLKHNLRVVEGGEERTYRYRHLGRATGRVSEAERILASLLDEHFFVEAIWVPVWRALEGKRGSILEVCGTPENLELAAYAYDFLMRTSDSLWRDHKRRHGIRRDRDRRQFVAGVMAGFRAKLQAQRGEHQAAGLIWMGDPGVGKYLRRRHPHVRTTRHTTGARSPAYLDGSQAGRELNLNPGLGARARGPSGGTPRLLAGKPAGPPKR